MADFLMGSCVTLLFGGIYHLFYRHLIGSIIDIACQENWSVRDLKQFLEE